MPRYALTVFLHILGATVWTGGHLVLALTILPRTLRERDPSFLLRFEHGFERLGIPAFIVQVVTGLWLAGRVTPPAHWLSFDGRVPTLIGVKLILLLTTVVLAVHARVRLIPSLDARRLPLLAVHIVGVTVVSVLFVLVGVALRTGL